MVIIGGIARGCLSYGAVRRVGQTVVALWLILASGAAAGACTRLTPDCIATFLTGLEKSWFGRATKTPVGPRPYDISFKRNAKGQLKGAARPAANSTHYWTFYQENQALELRFLSTFAGNTRPLLLQANAIVKNKWIFTSTRPRFLEVHVKAQPCALEIVIYLHKERHVEIHLQHRGRCPPNKVKRSTNGF